MEPPAADRKPHIKEITKLGGKPAKQVGEEVVGKATPQMLLYGITPPVRTGSALTWIPGRPKKVSMRRTPVPSRGTKLMGSLFLLAAALVLPCPLIPSLRADIIPFADQELVINGKEDNIVQIAPRTNPLFSSTNETIYVAGKVTASPEWNFKESVNQINFAGGSGKGFSFGPPFASQRWGVFDPAVPCVYSKRNGDSGEPAPLLEPGQSVQVVFAVNAGTGAFALYVNPDLAKPEKENEPVVTGTFQNMESRRDVKGIWVNKISAGNYTYSGFALYNSGSTPFEAQTKPQ